MTSPIALAVASLTLVLLVAAAWAHVREAPEFDAERWFKMMFATTLRGDLAARGGDAAAWEASVARFLAYHPAGRWPERKVAHPGLDAIVGKPVPGERALIASLAGLPREARWDWMHRDDPVGVDARLGDPDELGERYDPSRWIAEGWDGLAAWGASDVDPAGRRFREAAWRRLNASVMVIASDAPNDGEIRLFSALIAEGAAAATLADLREADPPAAARWVVVAAGDAPVEVLSLMAADLGVRERVVALVSVGGRFGSPEAMDRLAHLLAGDLLAAEVSRVTSLCSIAWFQRAVDPPGVAGLPIEQQRLPDAVAEGVEVVDLGVLPDDAELPGPQLARALLGFLACYLPSRG
jgi:hypothetical protein